MISLLVINYRSAAYAIEAVRSARGATSSSLHVVIVDNTTDVGEADRLRSHCDVLLTPDKNLGYAGGINAGRPHCRGDVMIVSNPDVIFGSGAIDELARALNDAAVAGPALYWDDALTWMLPPSDAPTAMSKLSEGLASRSSAFANARDRKRIRSRIEFWSRTTTTEVDAISGAIMAIRTADFDALGGFDERFALYFEENDFLRRLKRAGKGVVYVPAARCRHVYNQSAGTNGGYAARAFAESEMMFFTKWYGRFSARLLKRIERKRQLPDPPRIDGALRLESRNVVVEASPLRTFDTSAGHFPTSTTVDLPQEVWDAYLSPVLYLRVIDRSSGGVLATYARYRS